jgi:hypothetical protein
VQSEKARALSPSSISAGEAHAVYKRARSAARSISGEHSEPAIYKQPREARCGPESERGSPKGLPRSLSDMRRVGIEPTT